jgi:hypothetical protein
VWYFYNINPKWTFNVAVSVNAHGKQKVWEEIARIH